MSNKSKFLPVLALAVALAPFAASARTNDTPVQPAQAQYLVSVNNAAPTLTGRGNEPFAHSGVSAVVSESEYAAAANFGAAENE